MKWTPDSGVLPDELSRPELSRQGNELAMVRRPTCFTCGRTGHLQTSCPERRNPGYRSQIQPQQRTHRPNYSEDPGYNQPRDNYRSFPQQNRRDERLAVLDENWYDDEFVAQFRQTLPEQGYSGSVLEYQRASTQQENVEILSNDTVVFSKRRSQDAVKLHQDSQEKRRIIGCEPPFYNARRTGPFVGADDDVNNDTESTDEENTAGDQSATADPEYSQLRREPTLTRFIQKAIDVTARQSPSIATLAAVQHKEESELMKEIHRLESSFAAKLDNIYQRVDDRINSLAQSNHSRERNRQSKPVCYKCGRVGHIQYNCHYYRPEEQCKNQEVRQEYRAYYYQEENQHREPQSSAHLYTLDAQYARRVQDYHHKRESPGPELQTSRQPIRICKLNFEGEGNSTDPTIAILPKQDKTTSQKQTSASDQQKQGHVSLPSKGNTNLNLSDLTVEGEIVSHTVQLLVDTGACVSAIDKQFLTEIYGQFPPIMNADSLPFIQTVSGEKVPVLGKISIPLQLHGRKHSCEFHIMRGLAYDAVLGRDFLQNNVAQIDLVNSTLSFKEAGYLEKHTSTPTVPVVGTFSTQQKSSKVKKAVTTTVHPVPLPKVHESTTLHRSDNRKEMGLHRSLLALLLTLLYLITASHAQDNDYSVIQKLPKFFVHGSPDDTIGDARVLSTPVTHSQVIDKESDRSVETKEREAERHKVLKPGDIQKALKSDCSSPLTREMQDPQEVHNRAAIDVITARPGNQVPHS